MPLPSTRPTTRAVHRSPARTRTGPRTRPRTGAGPRARAATALLALALCAAHGRALADERTLVFDLSPFEPGGVSGEVWGIGADTGVVVAARVDATFVSNDTDDWTMGITFFGFPMGGLIGFSSELEGWSGVGTFTTSIESDALNGVLAPPEGQPFYSWFMEWNGGKTIELPGGGIAFGPMDGHFEVLTLTLTLAPCPDGDVDLPWEDLGGALAGSAGEPQFSAVGSLCAGEPGTMRLENAAPGSASHLVVGLSLLAAPFKGGVMIPHPDAIFSGLPVDGAGVSELPFVWPADVPSGLQLWLQHWIPDAGGPAGFAASNGLRGCVP